MHMADALISPAVGGTMLAAAAGTAAYAMKKSKDSVNEKKIPLMAIMAAFIFAAQMINFAIPGTGSSGHLGGGLLLCIILGPHAGFLAMMSVLIIQALFFADGGLLALGCNIMNMGFFTCFVAYPLIFKPLMKRGFSAARLIWVSLLAAVIGLQLGAFGVVFETFISGKTELPFATFVLLMQPIHFAIGIVEGIVTAAVVTYVWKTRPEIIETSMTGESLPKTISIKKVAIVLAVIALCTGAVLSWFASGHPDGLEWSMEKTYGSAELNTPAGVHENAAALQEKTAFLPDYSFRSSGEAEEPAEESWPAVSGGTSLSGILGGLMVLALACVLGFIVTIIKRRRKNA
ncbi:MAG: energy-coupling factor ABC transporter permease [Spirochaetota bacterium]